MVFIEKQQKGKSTYYYLTQTQRVGHKYKKIRVLLSDKPLPQKQLELLAKEKMPELQKLLLHTNECLFSTTVDESKLRDKYLIWERPCTLYFVFICAQVCVVPQTKNYGWGWGDTTGFFQNGMVKFIWDLKTFLEYGINIVNKLLNKSYFDEKIKQCEPLTQNLKQLYLKNKNLTTLNDAQLIQRMNEFSLAFKEWWAMSQVAESIAGPAEYLLKQVVDEKMISIITTPSQKSYSTQEEEEILKLALMVKKDTKLTKMFSLDIPNILNNLKKFPRYQETLSLHVNNYYWLQNNYSSVQYCDESFFIEQIKKIVEQGFDPQESLNIIHQRFEKIKEEKNHALSSLNLDEKYLQLIKIVDYFSIFQDDRKAILLEGHHYLNEFLKELSQRTGINQQLLQFSTPLEFESLLNGKFDVSELLQRQAGCVLIINESETIIKTGKEYHQLYHQFFGLKNKNEITEFEGRRAEGGKVLGKVRVILDPRKSEHFQTGEVLVTTMTSPDFVPLMRRASAIITDEGGITCHAAIVSRELGIPCVVGTKIATQVLKDDDVVEVNANHGIIKIKR